MLGHAHSSTVLSQHSFGDGEDVLDHNEKTNEEIDTAVVVVQKNRNMNVSRRKRAAGLGSTSMYSKTVH
jgi:stress response protein SCP2